MIKSGDNASRWSTQHFVPKPNQKKKIRCDARIQIWTLVKTQNSEWNLAKMKYTMTQKSPKFHAI